MNGAASPAARPAGATGTRTAPAHGLRTRTDVAPPPGLRARTAAALRRWFESRVAPTSALTLTQRNLYILPTKAGWAFAVTLVVMLVASINDQLNLGYALTFLLAGAGLASMLQTHANLRGLTFKLREVAPVTAGEAATFEFVVASPGARRHGVGVSWHAAGGAGVAAVDVPAQGSASARLKWTATRRGVHAVPAVRIDTHFPLGLFRAFTLWRPAGEWLVYPAPEAAPPPLPTGDTRTEAAAATRRAGGGEYDGVRPWRRGDTLRQIAWKKVARTDALVSRETSASATHGVTLDYAAAAPLDPEARLSRLAAWVLAAEREGRPYALAGPGGLTLPRGGGDAQRRAALGALARWGDAS